MPDPGGKLGSRALGAVVAAVALVAPLPLRADSTTELWLELSSELDLPPGRVAFDPALHIRFDQDIRRFERIMPEPVLKIAITDWLSVYPGFRVEYTRGSDDDFEWRLRLQNDIVTKKSFPYVTLDHRLRVQHTFQAGDDSDFIRNRLQVRGRQLDVWHPALSAELFHQLGDGDGMRLDTIRVTGGIGYGLGAQDVELFYRVEFPQADDEPTVHIIGAGYVIPS